MALQYNGVYSLTILFQINEFLPYLPQTVTTNSRKIQKCLFVLSTYLIKNVKLNLSFNKPYIDKARFNNLKTSYAEPSKIRKM